MAFADISTNEKMWEVLYASVFLEGAQQEEALRRCGVPLPPAAASETRQPGAAA